MGNKKSKVAIAQARLHHFRVPFYERLRELLAQEDVDLTLIYGQPNKFEQAKKDSGNIDWAIEIKNLRWTIGPVELLWQPYLKYIKGYDLVIVQQENRMLMNCVSFFVSAY